MGIPVTFGPVAPKVRFRVLKAYLDVLPDELEKAAEEGWHLCGCELRARPGDLSYALLAKYVERELTAEERAEYEERLKPQGPLTSPMDDLFPRIERLAAYLENKLGLTPPDEDPSGFPN